MLVHERPELPVELRADCLHFFVLGPGLGESIVICTPGGKWLVIDSYHNSRDGILAEFILNHYAVERIHSLVLTHPHQDHYRGLVELCDWNSQPPEIVAAVSSILT